MEYYEVTFRENEQGVRVPDTVKIVMPLDKRAIIVIYRSFHFADKELAAESFQLVFPDGIYVDDHIAQRYYKVGDIADEDRAVTEFMHRNAVTGDVPSKVRRGNVIRYTLMGIGLALIVFALYQMIRNRKKS